jgi:putative CocE/NonD family hydrolase
MGRKTPLYREWLSHPTFDSYWSQDAIEAADYARMKTRALVISGWFDDSLAGSLELWRGLRDHSPNADGQRLVIGPWWHREVSAGPSGSEVEGIDRGPNGSAFDVVGLAIDWFETCLKDAPRSAPRALVFMTGVNEWRGYDDYPAKEVQYRRLYFSSNGNANTAAGDGQLSWSAPEGPEAADRYVFDPRNPVPEITSTHASGGSAPPQVDHAVTEARADVLVYTSQPLTERLELLGPVSVSLVAASDARDTDWTATLIDVYPDGRTRRIGYLPASIIRARYRKGFDREVLLTPGRPERYTIELSGVGHAFLPGHRVRFEISSSAFPLYAPNQNTGNPVATDTEWKVANQTVFHEAGVESYATLPVMPILRGNR